MSVLAVAPAAQPAPYEEQVAALVDVAALVARGLDLDRRRFVPAPSDPLFGYARCPVRGCLNVTEHTATRLCSRCQHRYGRWQHATGGSDLEHFLAEVTQTRSEDLERLCLVCRTPGHERPAAAQSLCYSCLAQAKGRGQSVAAYIAGDERLPPAAPRPTFGPCRMACDALACGGDGLCGEHLRHWRRASRPAGAAFDAWRERVGEPLPGSRHVDLGGAERDAALGVPAGPVGRDRRAPAHPRQRTAPRRLADRPARGRLDHRARRLGVAHGRGAAVRLLGAGPAAPRVRRSRPGVAQGRLGHARVRQAAGLPSRLHADQPAVAARAGQAVGARAGAIGARRLDPPREQRARQPTAASGARAAADGQVTVASLRADLANAKAHNDRLRQQLRALEQRLSEKLGRDVADELDPGSARPDELRGELRDARAEIFELTESLADAREELDAVREINRELLADRNRPAR